MTKIVSLRKEEVEGWNLGGGFLRCRWDGKYKNALLSRRISKYGLKLHSIGIKKTWTYLHGYRDPTAAVRNNLYGIRFTRPYTSEFWVRTGLLKKPASWNDFHSSLLPIQMYPFISSQKTNVTLMWDRFLHFLFLFLSWFRQGFLLPTDATKHFEIITHWSLIQFSLY